MPADDDLCQSCGAPYTSEVSEVSGVYHWVCEHCGVVGDEHARMGKEEIEVSVESRGSSGVRFVGGDRETQKKVSEVSGAGLEPAHLAPAILAELARRTPDSPFADSKLINQACEMLKALLAAGKRPSVGGIEKLIAGCLYYASVEVTMGDGGESAGGTGGIGGTSAQLASFVKGATAVVADRLGGTGTKTSTSVVKSIGEVRKALVRADLMHRLPSLVAMDRVSAERAVHEYLALLDLTADGSAPPKTGMGAVYTWARNSALAAWGAGMSPSTRLVPALHAIEKRLAAVVLDCQRWTQRESVGENRNHTTHWVAFASLVVEAYSAMGEVLERRERRSLGASGKPTHAQDEVYRDAVDAYYRGGVPGEPSGLLTSPKYARVNPDYALPSHHARVASGALRLAVAASATNKAGGLKRPRPKKGDPEPMRPFPPRGRLLALNQKSVGQAVKDFAEEVRHYRRDLNRAVLRQHGLYLPRESYWRDRGLQNLGIRPSS